MNKVYIHDQNLKQNKNSNQIKFEPQHIQQVCI